MGNKKKKKETTKSQGHQQAKKTGHLETGFDMNYTSSYPISLGNLNLE
jgi:hypothetical protein